ncbi:hypothetical protein [Nocardioides sp. SYSU DS0651]|uniref:hypothetical protein n=1 Tax=Nocardioides sp. SYSU DS0651 TaxID=3415955 RepID=UPI003F4C7319
MSYPPPPPSGQPWPGPPASPPPSGPPGWGPPPGPPGLPPQGPPPGPPYGGPPYGGPPSGGPPRRNVGLVVALVGLAVVVLSALGVGAFFLVSAADEDDDRRAGDGPSSTSTSAPTGPTSPTSPTGPPSSTSPPHTPYTPSDDTGDDIHGDVKRSDFPGDWDFKLGDVEHKARLVSSRDHDSCAPVEAGNALSRQRCEYAVQWTYTSLQGKVRLTHVFLVFDTERHAKAAQKKLDDKQLDLPPGSTWPSFVQGKWNSSVYGNIVGVTIGTSKTQVREKRLTSLVNYMNTDYRLALTFKL